MRVVETIIIKTVNYNDTQRIVRTFSREAGYLSFIVPAYQLKKRGEQVHPMQLVEIEFESNDRSTLHKCKSITPRMQSHALYFDIVKMNIALLWGEFLDLVLRTEKQNTDLFDFLLNSITYLDAAGQGIGNFNLYFLYRLPTFIGFKIDTLSYRDGYIFNVENGKFYPADAGKPATAGPNAARIIYQLASHPLSQLENLKLNRQSRSILLDILIRYLSDHLNTEFNTPTVTVIRSVFEDE
ncbi:MAG: DNA repair protein RecO [Marinifilaceae bacterium]